MIYLLTFIHVIVCLFLIAVVLLQSGKAADLAGAFGGMGSQTAFGPRGSATALSRATTVAAALFMVTSLSLSVLATRNQGGHSTVLDSTGATKKTPAKAPEGKSGGSTQIQIPGQPAPGTEKTKGFQVPEVQVPGSEKAKLPAPGELGGIVVPPNATPEQVQKLVQQEMEKMKKAEAEAAKKGAATTPSPKK
jgi:preprotein translocase subunit SecG